MRQNKELENKVQALTGLDLRTVQNGMKDFDSELSPEKKLAMFGIKTIAVNIRNEKTVDLNNLNKVLDFELNEDYELLEEHAERQLELLKEKFNFYHLLRYDDIADIVMSNLDNGSYQFKVWAMVKELNKLQMFENRN